MTKMPLAEHNNVVKALPSDRADKSFNKSVLPWGACWVCCDVDPDEVSAAEPNDDEGIEHRSKPIVGTTNRSMAAMSGAWLCKKVRHP